MRESDTSFEAASRRQPVADKPVLSLDTNYLSNLARARKDEGLPSHVLDVWKDLLDALIDAVWDDRLICPGFNIQVEELEMDDRIAASAWVVMRSLSLGLAFHTFDGIVARQVEDVVRKFMQQPPVEEPAWKRVMQEDPDLPAAEMSLRSSAKGVTLGFSDRNTVQKRRQGKTIGVGDVITDSGLDVILQGSASESRLAFGRLVIGQRLMDTLVGSQLSPGAWCVPARTDEWSEMVSRLQSVGMGFRELIEFLQSPWLAHIPFVDLYCSVARAAAHQGTTGRPDEPGDEADRCIVSTLLPYCSLLTTDRFVKHLITTELDLAAQYGCQVFSGKVEDVRLLTEVIRMLPAVTL